MIRKYILSVDGGGSKTEFCIGDRDGNILFSEMVGPTSHKSVGKIKALENMRIGLKAIADKGVNKDDLLISIWGLSGYDTVKDEEIMNEMIQSCGLKKDRYVLCNDSLLAFYAQTQKPGMVLVAGTGAVTFGIKENGETFRSGGWGYGFSDLGGGYWIGNEVLKETLLYCDGCRDFDPLFDAVRCKMKKNNFNSLCEAISDMDNPFHVADFASLAFAVEMSTVSRKIIRKASQLLAALIVATYNKMNCPTEDFTIVMAGSVLKSKCLFNMVSDEICCKIQLDKSRIVLLQKPPATGGIRMAQTLLEKTNGNLQLGRI